MNESTLQDICEFCFCQLFKMVTLICMTHLGFAYGKPRRYIRGIPTFQYHCNWIKIEINYYSYRTVQHLSVIRLYIL